MKFSIVMPSMDQRHFLVEAVESVLGQEGAFDLELIVIDGGSSDGSVEWLRSVDDDRLCWASESDRGQADAVNKGIARASGGVIGWLNSDDRYAQGTLAAVAQAFVDDEQAQWVVGRCGMINEAGEAIRHRITQYKDRRLLDYQYHRLLRENFISQMGVFWRHSFGQQIGLLDDKLHYTMDYDLWLRMGLKTDPLVVDRVLADFRLHTQSKSGRVAREQFDEQFRVALRYIQEDDRLTRIRHRLNVEKIVWAYRLMRLLGW